MCCDDCNVSQSKCMHPAFFFIQSLRKFSTRVSVEIIINQYKNFDSILHLSMYIRIKSDIIIFLFHFVMASNMLTVHLDCSNTLCWRNVIQPAGYVLPYFSWSDIRKSYCIKICGLFFPSLNQSLSFEILKFKIHWFGEELNFCTQFYFLSLREFFLLWHH